MLLWFFVSPKWNPTSTPQSFPISLTDTSHLLLSVWAASLFALWHWSRWSTGLYISAQSSGYSLLLLLDIPSPTFKPFIPITHLQIIDSSTWSTFEHLHWAVKFDIMYLSSRMLLGILKDLYLRLIINTWHLQCPMLFYFLMKKLNNLLLILL